MTVNRQYEIRTFFNGYERLTDWGSRWNILATDLPLQTVVKMQQLNWLKNDK